MFCARLRSCARADDAKIVRSRNAQCKARESPKHSEILIRSCNRSRGEHAGLKLKLHEKLWGFRVTVFTVLNSTVLSYFNLILYIINLPLCLNARMHA